MPSIPPHTGEASADALRLDPEEVVEQAEGEARVRRSRTRLIVAGVLYVLNYVLGLPMLLAIEALAAWWQEPWMAAFLGPAVYGVSWLMLLAALWLGGPEIVALTRAFLRRLRARLRRS